ncbi:MAG: WecB/TagA/CpsF family glycosyltransferase [Muribaculaceae bacterium]|nr:WecB/TagA/CpsF family glycosyltransferase [Muribaculaceae bacterium]MBR5745009.1 WecB/TagA/CpsF family glycosyltransferase [Muribaculaceae bacterium]
MTPVSLNGLNVYPFTSVDEILEYVDRNPSLLVAINAEKVVNADDLTREIVNGGIGYCDGAGAVKAVKRKGAKDAIRIPGCELWLHIIERYQKEKTFYVVGAKKEVNDEVVAKLRTDFPDIRIVGHRDGYIRTDEERQALIDDVAEKRPDVVFVAMGSPKQELLMGDMRRRHEAIYQGLGGSFDVYTGRIQRAPKWWREHNLEFAYRFLKQPSRFRRELKRLKFAWWMLIGKV